MLRIFNTLGRELQVFKPIEDGKIRMYTCGPTVYDYVSIGNWRTYILGDLIYRTLKFMGYDVKYVMNVTDVGHLTGDNSGDADTGEDRLEKASRRESKNAWDIAKFYTQDFLDGVVKMNLEPPLIFSKATDHIPEQIDLVKILEEKGFTYKISDGIYFDTNKYEEKGYKYGEISNLDEIKEGARVEINPEKRNPRDFALWKFSPKDAKRDMEWNSPWGMGFPGWHIECSAMSMKYLGNQLDIHIGGEDLKSTHHPNEIAQSESATGKHPFVFYWIHGAFLLVDGGRMGKSLGNAYKLQDLEEKGFTALYLRYFYLTGHYRKQINFTWEGLEASKNAYKRLNEFVRIWLREVTNQAAVNSQPDQTFMSKFTAALEDDFNLPQALAITWELTKAALSAEAKLATIQEFDKVLGLDLVESSQNPNKLELPTEAKILIEERNIARINKDWNKADEIREKLEKEYNLKVKDTSEGQVISKA